MELNADRVNWVIFRSNSPFLLYVYYVYPSSTCWKLFCHVKGSTIVPTLLFGVLLEKLSFALDTKYEYHTETINFAIQL
jgi:hypothetical protein